MQKRKSAVFAKYYLLNLDKKKNDRFNVIEKRQRSRFIAFRFFTEIIIAKPKVNIHTKIQSLFLLRSDFFLLFRFPGRATAFCSGASWFCLDCQHHCYMACWEVTRIFDNVRSCPHSFHIYTKSTATTTYYGNCALVVILSGHEFQNMPW